jgi:hypothetical protein
VIYFTLIYSLSRRSSYSFKYVSQILSVHLVCGKAICTVHSFPELMVRRKLCSLTIAATRLIPFPNQSDFAM